MKVEANTFRKHSHKTWNFERRPPPRYRSQYLRICDLYKELEFFCSRPHHCARSGFGMLRPTPRSHCRRIWLEEQFWARVLENHRAETAVEVVYPEANVFEVYNVVDKKTQPDSVLEFVVGALTNSGSCDASLPKCTLAQSGHDEFASLFGGFVGNVAERIRLKGLKPRRPPENSRASSSPRLSRESLGPTCKGCCAWCRR